jgi:hypothetical protein
MLINKLKDILEKAKIERKENNTFDVAPDFFELKGIKQWYDGLRKQGLLESLKSFDEFKKGLNRDEIKNILVKEYKSEIGDRELDQLIEQAYELHRRDLAEEEGFDGTLSDLGELPKYAYGVVGSKGGSKKLVKKTKRIKKRKHEDNSDFQDKTINNLMNDSRQEDIEEEPDYSMDDEEVYEGINGFVYFDNVKKKYYVTDRGGKAVGEYFEDTTDGFEKAMLLLQSIEPPRGEEEKDEAYTQKFMIRKGDTEWDKDFTEDELKQLLAQDAERGATDVGGIGVPVDTSIAEMPLSHVLYSLRKAGYEVKSVNQYKIDNLRSKLKKRPFDKSKADELEKKYFSRKANESSKDEEIKKDTVEHGKLEVEISNVRKELRGLIKTRYAKKDKSLDKKIEDLTKQLSDLEEQDQVLRKKLRTDIKKRYENESFKNYVQVKDIEENFSLMQDLIDIESTLERIGVTDEELGHKTPFMFKTDVDFLFIDSKGSDCIYAGKGKPESHRRIYRIS